MGREDTKKEKNEKKDRKEKKGTRKKKTKGKAEKKARKEGEKNAMDPARLGGAAAPPPTIVKLWDFKSSSLALLQLPRFRFVVFFVFLVFLQFLHFIHFLWSLFELFLCMENSFLNFWNMFLFFLNSLTRFLILCYFAPFWRCVSVGMLANVRVSKHGLRVWAPYFCAKRYISLVCVCVCVCLFA